MSNPPLSRATFNLWLLVQNYVKTTQQNRENRNLVQRCKNAVVVFLIICVRENIFLRHHLPNR